MSKVTKGALAAMRRLASGDSLHRESNRSRVCWKDGETLHHLTFRALSDCEALTSSTTKTGEQFKLSAAGKKLLKEAGTKAA